MFSRAVAVIGATTAAMGLLSSGALAAGPPPPTAANGATVEQVAAGLGTPTSFAFGAGTVFEGDGGNNQSGPPNGGVYVLKGGAATKLVGSPNFVGGLAWHKNTLYVSSGTVAASGKKFQILAWSGWNGTSFTKKKAIYTAPKKLDGFNGLAFGPDGRLYVGVDLGLTDGNDHGPANKTPYLYDILSMNSAGKDLKVFASGIRQPWQMVFPAGSSAPFVSDLGQDSGVKNAPDFLLRVHRGDNFGFPSCAWVKPTVCKGYTKPAKFFAPHTDVMGLAIIGKVLYMSEFGGAAPGKVVSMPLSGGKVKPVLTGFVAPVVGLAANGHWLYVGELTGQVFRVKQ
jgi:glucose/arabinose dehydrogenase